MSHLYPNYARLPVSFVRGEGATLWDSAGRRYLDFTAGIAVNNLGHVPSFVKARIRQQLDRVWHTSNLFEQPMQEALATELTRLSGMDVAFFCNSGAEANEAAVKLARRYAQEVMGKRGGEVITFERSFHGRTLAMLAATGQDKVKQGFSPLPSGFKSVPYNDLDELEAAVTEETCAVMLEVIQAEGGVYPAERAWLKGVRALCDTHGVLLLVDEVQTGMGRTGHWFGFQAYGVEPDVITLAKGLASGVPAGAMLGKEKTRAAFTPGAHGSTFGGTPLVMSAALATVEAMEREQIPQRAAEMGALLMHRLRQELAQLSTVREIRGRGLLIGIELDQLAAPVIEAAMEKGLLLLSAGPQVLRLLPPLIIDAPQIEEAVAIIVQLLKGTQPNR